MEWKVDFQFQTLSICYLRAVKLTYRKAYLDL